MKTWQRILLTLLNALATMMLVWLLLGELAPDTPIAESIIWMWGGLIVGGAATWRLTRERIGKT